MIYSNDQYFEAILQLRPNKREILNFVKQQIDQREGVFIVKEVEQKTGIDLYLTSNKFALALGKLLKKKFKGIIKISRTLHTRHKQTGKLLYRVTVCFRLQKDL
ncbi:MAG: hypothetical protein KJ674_03925 [Nanoarchaeota archaeon]|nr:hypothetical protein [Nanoarchaeota archaeon]